MSDVLLPPSPNWYGAHIAAASPDGELLAYAARNSVVVACPRSQAVLGLLTGHSNRVTAVAFARLGDGGQLVLVSAAADCTLRLWDPRARACLGVVKKQHCPAEPAALAACGGVAFVGDKGGRVQRWSLEQRSLEPLVPAQRAAVSCLAALAGSSACVAVGRADGTVTVVSEAGDLLQLPPHAAEVHSLCWLPLELAAAGGAAEAAGILASGAADGRLMVSRLRTAEGRTSAQLAYALSLPSPHAGISKAQRSRLWLAAAWVCQEPGTAGSLTLVAASYAGQLHAWDISTAEGPAPGAPVALPPGHSRSVFSVCFVPGAGHEALLATTSMDRSLLLWSVPSRRAQLDWKAAKVVWRLAGLGGHAAALAALPGGGGRWACGCGDTTLRVWRAGAAAEAVTIWRGLTASVTALAWSPDGRLALGCGNGEVGLCDADRGVCSPASIRHQAPVRCLQWLCTAQLAWLLVSMCEAGQMLIWPAAALPAKESAGRGESKPAAASAPVKLSSIAQGVADGVPATAMAAAAGWAALGFSDGRVCVLVVKCLPAAEAAPAGRVLGRMLSHPAAVTHLVAQPSALAVAHMNGCVACIRGLERRSEGLDEVALEHAAAPALLGQQPTALAWSAGGLLAVATVDRHIHVLATQPAMQVLHKLSGHNGSVQALCWSPEAADRLLSGAEDQTVRAWDVATAATPGGQPEAAKDPEASAEQQEQAAALAAAKQALLARLEGQQAEQPRQSSREAAVPLGIPSALPQAPAVRDSAAPASREGSSGREPAAAMAEGLLEAAQQFSQGSSAAVLGGMDQQLSQLLRQLTVQHKQEALPAQQEQRVAEQVPAAAREDARVRRELTPGTSREGAPAANIGPAPVAAPGSKKRKDPTLGARPLLLPLQPDNAADTQAACAACLDVAAQLASGTLSSTAHPMQASAGLQEHVDACKQVPHGASQAQRLAALELLRGNVAGALRAAIDADCLTADFVSLAAQAGRAAWVAASKAYAARLEAMGEPQMAALHLLATQDVAGALALYCRAGLLREAVALAQLRLLPGDPRLAELQAAWAEQLQAEGLLAPAAEAFLRGGQYAAAVAALAKSGVEGAKAAALQVAKDLLQSPLVNAEERDRLTALCASLEEELRQVPPAPPAALLPGAGPEVQKRRYSADGLLALRPIVEGVTLPEGTLAGFPSALRRPA